MAKKPQDEGKQHRPTPAAQKAAELQEEQQQQVEAEVEQLRDTQQDQLGNQEIATMLGLPSVAPGSAGLSVEGDERDFDQGFQFGGDDDDPVPVYGPQTLADLTREWNKGTQRGRDTHTFREPMPGEALPPEDEALAARIRADPDHPDLPPPDTVDALLQPSEAVIGGDIGSWLREAMRWAGGELPQRTLGHAILPAAPPLLDPHGRVFLARARSAAIATLIMRDGPVLRQAQSPEVTGFVDVCLELAGQRHTVLDVWWRAQQAQLKLPVAAKVLGGELAGRRGGPGREAELAPSAQDHVVAVLKDLVDLPSATTLVPFVPELTQSAEEEDNDPLDLDAVLDQFTGGRPDPLESLYAAVTHGAERLASAVARSRVRIAGVSRALCEVGDQWIAGAPVAKVLALARHVDDQSGRILTLIVEIAQAARKRSVDPQGIRNGLRRAAKMIDKLVRTTLKALAKLVGGLLPTVPEVPEVFVPDPDDPLVGAWGDGAPADALPWLATQPEGWDREASLLFTRVGAGEAATTLADPLLALADTPDARPHLAEAARVIAGSCLLWSERHQDALAVAKHHVALGRSRRNGLLMASGALLAMEVYDRRQEHAALEALRYEVAKDAWHMGQRAAFALMVRWRGAEQAPDAVEAFLD